MVSLTIRTICNTSLAEEIRFVAGVVVLILVFAVYKLHVTDSQREFLKRVSMLELAYSVIITVSLQGNLQPADNSNMLEFMAFSKQYYNIPMYCCGIKVNSVFFISMVLSV